MKEISIYVPDVTPGYDKLVSELIDFCITLFGGVSTYELTDYFVGKEGVQTETTKVITAITSHENNIKELRMAIETNYVDSGRLFIKEIEVNLYEVGVPLKP